MNRPPADYGPSDRLPYRLAGWAVHAYTAMGAVAGLLTLEYTARGRFRAAFIMMAVATVIDSSDGPMARAVHVKDIIPDFDGALLDNIIDYLNYVVTPAFLMMHAALLPRGIAGPAAGCAVMLSSAFGFCRVHAKTPDHYFLGFPSYWNLVALYLFCLGGNPRLNAAIVFGLAAMVFTPIKFIYPNRTERLRVLTLALAVAWAFLIAAILYRMPHSSPVLVWLSLTFIGYYFLMSFALQLFK